MADLFYLAMVVLSGGICLWYVGAADGGGCVGEPQQDWLL
jgi:hypothetical protein